MSTRSRILAPVRASLTALIVGSLLAAAPVSPVYAGDDQPETDDGLDIFFRDSDLTALAEQGWAEYSVMDPGESSLLDRSFEGAPPQIPHTMQDLLPILADDNVCWECHSPDEYETAESTSIPASHFERPRIVGGPDSDAEGAMRVQVADYQSQDDLAGFYFNCVQCHVPQANNVSDITSTFVGGDMGR